MGTAPTTFTSDDLLRCLRLGFTLAADSGLGHHQQVAAIVGAGYPKHLADRFVNLIPILAGRRFLITSGPPPKLANYYMVVDHLGHEQMVRFGECDICKSIERYLDRCNSATIIGIGMRSCEVVAINIALNHLAPDTTEDSVADIAVEAPQMNG